MPTIVSQQSPQPPTRPGSAPAGRPARRPPSAEEAARIREQLLLFLLLLLGLILVTQLPLPFRLGGFVLALGTGWVGIRLLASMLRATRAGVKIGGRPSVIIGLGLTAALTMVLTVQTIYYPMTADRERCISGANTLKARDNCERIYQDRLEDLTDDLRGRNP